MLSWRKTELDPSVGFTTGKRPEGSSQAVAYDLGLSFAIGFTTPLGEKDTLKVMERLLEERLQMQKQATPLSLLGNAQTRMVIIINGHVSQTCLISL